MKKLAFTLAGVTMITACGLIIDPDKLIEGNADDAGTGSEASNTDGPVGGDTGTGPETSTDAGSDSSIFVTVPECVPPKPTTTGAEGPYAVVFAKGSDPPPTCPTGYLPTAIKQGKTNALAQGAQCDSATGCSCGAPSGGTPSCGFRLRYYDTSSCTTEADTSDTIGTSCKDVDSENYLKLEYNVQNVSCPASGTATPTSKPTPTWLGQLIVCAPDPAVTTAQCKGGQVPLPPATDAAACVLVPTNASCFSGEYNSPVSLSTTGGFTDTRACTCQCVGAQSSCTGGSVTLYSGILCTGTPRSLTVDAGCTTRGGDDSAQATAPTAGTPACDTRAMPSGQVTPSYDVKLCCYDPNGGN